MRLSVPKKVSGFTLIELLIVVAIIAILAAIAVPNFLEAQVRSKVSRVKSDMRSVGVAIEAYAVDNNHYPPKKEGVLPAGAIDVPGSGLGSWVPSSITTDGYSITTPIAYLTSLPLDVFAANTPLMNGVAGNHPIKSFRYFRQVNHDMYIGSSTTSQILAANKGSDQDASVMLTLTISRLDRWGAWYMISFGPDVDPDVPGSINDYDPTNGTVSNGDIFYSARRQFSGQLN